MLKPKSVDHYIESIPKWEDSLKKIRAIFLNSGLNETIKWVFPVYTYKNKNVVSLAGFKNYVGIWFFYGSFLADQKKVLIYGENAKTMMQMRFLSLENINKEQINNFIQQSIILIDKGVKIPKIAKGKLIIPKILKDAIKKEGLEINFNNFTTSKKREFSNYITNAKRETTVLKRIKKIIPLIKMNIGLNDKYKKN